MLSNPYDKSATHKVASRVSPIDFFYLKKKLPMVPGLTDKLIAILYSNFVETVKEYERINGPIEPAWELDHPTYTIIEQLLQRHALGQSDGCSCSRTSPGGTGGVCETLCDSALQRANPQSSDCSRRPEETKEEGLGGTGNGTLGSDVARARKLLADLGL